jgi:hypothetical protein
MTRRAGRLIVLVICLTCAGSGAAATTQSPADIGGPPARIGSDIRLTGTEVLEIARAAQRVPDWLRDHPATARQPVRDPKTPKIWTVSYADERNAIQAQVLVRDSDGTIVEERVGPQVAWQMARGYPGAFGRSITKPIIWIPLLLLFLIPLLRWRRLISWRTLDLVVLCAFSVSLIWFTEGMIFTSVPLSVPPLVYLGIRLAAVGLRGVRQAPTSEMTAAEAPRSPRLVSSLPTWLLIALMMLALGVRLGLNAFDSNVIDVGYAGVIGADRIVDGTTPYGAIPDDVCRRCDTYGPVMYLLYVPFETVLGWSGRWDDLPAAHGAAVFFDLAALAGLLLLGWRLGGARLAAGFGLAWTAFPFTAYALESNANDAMVAACMAWGLVAAHRPFARGVWIGLAALAKFTPAILIPLWLRHPFPRARPLRRWPRYVAGLAAVAVASGWVVLLDGWSGAQRFWDRTVGFQLGRDSPFSLWGQYTWLRPVQIALGVSVGLAALIALRRPRELDLRRFAAVSGALLVGVQLVLTHWFYLYIPWFLPFVIVALLPAWPSPAATPDPKPEPDRADAPAGGLPVAA